jgi:hypothetical protein
LGQLSAHLLLFSVQKTSKESFLYTDKKKAEADVRLAHRETLDSYLVFDFRHFACIRIR